MYNNYVEIDGGALFHLPHFTSHDNCYASQYGSTGVPIICAYVIVCAVYLFGVSFSLVS